MSSLTIITKTASVFALDLLTHRTDKTDSALVFAYEYILIQIKNNTNIIY